MGTLDIIGLVTADFNIASLSLQISAAGGIVIGIVVFFLLLVIAGFLIFKYINKSNEDEDIDEDRILGENKGISQKKVDI